MLGREQAREGGSEGGGEGGGEGGREREREKGGGNYAQLEGGMEETSPKRDMNCLIHLDVRVFLGRN